MSKRVPKQQAASGHPDVEKIKRLLRNNADPRVLEIVFHAVFAPRSVAGKYHWDPLMAVILFTLAELGDGKRKISFREFITAHSKNLKETGIEGELGLFRESRLHRTGYTTGYARGVDGNGLAKCPGSVLEPLPKPRASNRVMPVLTPLPDWPPGASQISSLCLGISPSVRASG
jgi:hypothetical protein